MKLSASVTGLLLAARLVHAQVPLVSVDLLVGAAPHNSAGGTYKTDPVPTLRLATTIRLGSSATTRPILKAEFEPRRGDNGSFGAPGPFTFPPTGGVSYALGVSHVAGTSSVVGAAVGGGRYGGPYRGTRHNSVFGEAEVARQIRGHASLVANIQYRRWVAEGTRFWYAPITIGLRLF